MSNDTKSVVAPTPDTAFAASQSEAFAIEIDVKFDEYCQVSNEAADCKCGDICKLYGLCKGSYLAGAKFGSEQATSRIRELEATLKRIGELQTEVEAVKESLNTQRELAIVSGMRIDNLQQENEALRAEKSKWKI